MNEQLQELRDAVKQQLGTERPPAADVDPAELTRFSPDLPDRLDPERRAELERRAGELAPWLQGPFLLGGDLVVGGAWRNDTRWMGLGPELPQDMSGMRVLDVGSNAGYDPFMFKLRGADHVLACEPFLFIEQAQFLEQLYRSGVDFRQIGWEALDPAVHGRFDLVHCHGVLYHEPHPLAMLMRLREMLADDGKLLFGSMQLADVELSEHLRFVPGAYYGDETWWFVPGRLALRWMLESVGLTVEREFGLSDGPPGEFRTINGYLLAGLGEPHPALNTPFSAAARGAPAPVIAAPVTEPPRQLLERPWRSVELPDHVLQLPTMLPSGDLAMLYWMAREYCSGAGRIVDGGCFLGGSTRALLAGLDDRDDTAVNERIVSYDRFEVEEYFLPAFGHLLPTAKVGDSFRPAFDANLAGFEDRIEVKDGDILDLGWIGEPIELLFLDIVKTWEINDFAMREFFPHLIPGRSIVIQQDYNYGGQPWIHITMELLADHFSVVDDVTYGSRVFLLQREIPTELLQTSVANDLSRTDQLRLMDRAVAKTSDESRGMLEIARATLLVEHRRPADAAKALRSVREAFSDREPIQRSADDLASWSGI